MSISHWFRHEVTGRLITILRPLLYLAAAVWRRLMFRTVFIAVTGSHGKTTAKELTAAILSAHSRTFKSVRNQNSGRLLPLNVLRVRPWHRYAVFEVATGGPGALVKAGRLLRPDIAAVTSVGSAHRSSFENIEAIGREKKSLLGSLRGKGVGLLNGDDPHLGPPWNTAAPVLRFGRSSGCHYSFTDSSSEWPRRLQFTLCHGGGRYQVKTSLVGEHWIPSVLASLAISIECGISIETALKTLAAVLPFDARMGPVLLPCGAIVIRDEYCGTPESFETAFQAFSEARAKRKILVAGDYSDSSAKIRSRLRKLGRQASKIADIAVFVGPSAHHSREAALREGMPDEACHYFTNPQAAAEHLKSLLIAEDLVLLKGRINQHLSRLIFDQVAPVRCWRPTCPERFLCDICWRLGLSRSEIERIKAI
ncbi:MAG: UDP-N-acetylmuramoyl-tripeptide--D-alanyl-D-alanine ligase [Acidobacteriota bacterium]|nr:MAG: UDP-N-acetylmuramoyl-tripeptide--D-alanyl-D-alanine ligase [Acidobacteriota bacterium]